MKKIGIITIHKINNYGALLQAYALNKYLRDCGYDVQTIDYQSVRVKESYEIFEPIRNVMSVVRNLMSLIYYKKKKKRNRRFKAFAENDIPLTENTYYKNDEITDLDFDYYICGSDQIWNTHCTNFSVAYTFEFVEDKSKCISYAASIGSDTIDSKYTEVFKNNLNQFRAVSCREQQGKDILNTMIDKDIQVVMDPVYLLDGNEWEIIGNEDLVKKPYIFYYSVAGGNEEMRTFVKKMHKDLNLPVVAVNAGLRDMKLANIKMYEAGPKEFVSLIKNAEFVCTNSFHATSFSLIFRKKFWSFVRLGKGSGAGRLVNVAEIAGVEERLLEKSPLEIDYAKEIDFECAWTRLDKEILKSKEFLRNALKNDA